MSEVAQSTVARLVDAGVRRAYTVPGESFLPLIDAFDQHPDVTLVSTRHESGASFMAEAEAKITGVPAVAMATRCVGASNLAIGVHTAFQDSTPMVVLLGQVSRDALGREAFQEVDLPDFYRGITKWSTTVHDPDRLVEQLDRGLHAATTGRPGPVMLAIPEDVLNHDAAPSSRWCPGVVRQGRASLDDETAGAIQRLVSEAVAPVVIAGGGAQHARDELVDFSERYGAGVYSGFRRQDVFPNDHPNYCGHLTLGTPPEVLHSLREADVVVVIGSRLSEITTQGYSLPTSDQRVVQVDVEPGSVGSVCLVEIGAVADAALALRDLVNRAPGDRADRDWTSAHDTFLVSSTPPETCTGRLHPAEVMGALARTFPPSTIVTNDAGNFSVFAHRYWRFSEPRTQVAPTSGAMGYGVPAAIGAQLASPDREVVALAGDGGFLMTGQELETAVRLELPLTVVVFRNGLYGTIALHQGRRIGRTAAVEIGNVDVAALARAYGAEAWQVTDRREIDGVFREARSSRHVAVIDVLVDPDVLTPGVRLSELMGS